MKISEFLLTDFEYEDSCAETEKTHFINFKLFVKKQQPVYNYRTQDIVKRSYKYEKEWEKEWEHYFNKVFK